MRTKILVAILCIEILALFGLPGQVRAYSGSEVVGCPIPDTLSIYSGPGQQYPVVDWLVSGTCVVFDERTSDNRWIRIMSGEQQVSSTGWVDASALVLGEKMDALMVTEAQTPAAAVVSNVPVSASGVSGCVVDINGLRIRYGPSTGYPEVGFLLKNACVELTGRSPDGSWVLYDRGWVNAYYLQISGEVSQLPVVHVAPLGREKP